MMTTRKRKINRYIGAKLKSARNNKYIMGCLTDVFLWKIERGINSIFENPNSFYIDEDAVESFIVCLGSAFLDFMDMNLYSHNCIQCILVSMKVKMCLFPWTSKTNGSTAKQDLDLTEVNRRLKKRI